MNAGVRWGANPNDGSVGQELARFAKSRHSSGAHKPVHISPRAARRSDGPLAAERANGDLRPEFQTNPDEPDSGGQNLPELSCSQKV